MRVALYSRTGPPHDVLTLVERPCPEPRSGEVRVRVAWSGVNPSDVKSRAGTRSKTLPYAEVTPHSDGAGAIDAGPGVATDRIGERVWVWNAAWGRADGKAAEWLTLPAAQAIRLPDSVPLDVGANLGIPALTALHSLTVDGGVRDKCVLIAGGAGAVGHYVVQMARLLGARQVIATVSSEKAALAWAAGAEMTIDYRRENVAERISAITDNRGVDRIVEVDFGVNGAHRRSSGRNRLCRGQCGD